jgi:tetratricopeptide (TPR) repeat protein
VLSANNLAWILATAPDERLRNDKEALRLADIACRANDFESPDLLDTLAAANANAGRYDNAVQWVDKAIAIATTEKNSRLASALKTRREAYLAKRPYRDPGLAPAPGSPTR